MYIHSWHVQGWFRESDQDETQCITLRLEDFTYIFYSNDLSRCKTDNRSFLIVIPLSAINQITVLLVFQKNYIKPKVCRICRIGFAFERFITLTSGCKVSTPSISSYSVMVSKFNNSVFIGRYLYYKYKKGFLLHRYITKEKQCFYAVNLCFISLTIICNTDKLHHL